MKLKNIKIQNFLSIKEISFNLDNRGLVLIQGKNFDNSNFDSNGAGKTSFIEALAWVLFGKTVKGLKGDEVIHKQVKRNCSVSLSFTDDNNNEFTVCRYRKDKQFKNSVMLFKGDINITQKSDKDTTEYIESLFQMNYDIFTSTLLYSSHSFKFTSSSDSEMKKSLDLMLNMEIWNKCLEETKNRKADVENEKNSITKTIDYNEKYITMFTKQLADIKQKERENKANWIKTKEKYEANIRNTEKLLSDLIAEAPSEADIIDFNDKQKKVTTELKDIEDKINEYSSLMDTILELKAEVSALTGSISSIDYNLDQLQEKAETYLSKLKDKESLVGTFCPVCGSKVTEKSIDKVTSEIKSELLKILEKIGDYKSSRIAAEKQINIKKKQIAELQIEYNKQTPLQLQKKELEQKLYRLKNNKENFLNSIKSYKKEKAQYEETIDMNKAYIKECESKMNDTFADSIKNLTNSLIHYSEEQISLNDKLEEINLYISYLDNWIVGFSNKGIKSLLLDNITPFLNQRTNYYLNKLSSGTIEVEFKTQNENKTGELKDKFTMNIRNSSGGDTYNSNSDGEKRRIDIAVNLALQDLISHRSSKTINIAFFDECFDSLDAIGCERIIEVLQENINHKSSIFVTSHNEQLKTFFDKSIILTKKDGFTTLKSEM